MSLRVSSVSLNCSSIPRNIKLLSSDLFSRLFSFWWITSTLSLSSHICVLREQFSADSHLISTSCRSISELEFTILSMLSLMGFSASAMHLFMLISIDAFSLFSNSFNSGLSSTSLLPLSRGIASSHGLSVVGVGCDIFSGVFFIDLLTGLLSLCSLDFFDRFLFLCFTRSKGTSTLSAVFVWGTTSSALGDSNDVMHGWIIFLVHRGSFDITMLYKGHISLSDTRYHCLILFLLLI